MLGLQVKRGFAAMARSDVDLVVLAYEPDAEVWMRSMAGVGVSDCYRGHAGVRTLYDEIDDAFDHCSDAPAVDEPASPSADPVVDRPVDGCPVDGLRRRRRRRLRLRGSPWVEPPSSSDPGSRRPWSAGPSPFTGRILGRAQARPAECRSHSGWISTSC